MRYISVCSGVEAASLAWAHMGWTPVAFSEIEPFPCAVLAHRFPGVPNLGDMTRVAADENGDIHHGADGLLRGARVDLLVGGTPCQSFSVAGKREGLRGASGLALDYIRLAYELAAHCGLRWILWENVPGVFSSGRGEDFAAFLSGLAGWDVAPPAGGWGNAGVVANATAGNFGLAFRTLDAQYVRVEHGFPFAIPQRRRRVFVVGRLGDWERAAEVLFEGEGLYGHTPPRREAQEGAAARAEGGAGEAGRRRPGMKTFAQSSFGAFAQSVTGGTIRSRADIPGAVLCYDMMGSKGNANVSADGVCPTIATTHNDMHAVCFQQNQRDEVRLTGGDGKVAGAVSAQSGAKQQNYVAAFLPDQGVKARGLGYEVGVACTLRASGADVGVLCYENHPQDSRIRESGGGNGPLVLVSAANSNGGDVMPALTVSNLRGQVTSQNDKTGGYVLETVSVHGTMDPCVSVECGHTVGRNNGGENCVAIASTVIGRSAKAGDNGPGFKEGVAYTLDTSGVQGVMHCSFVRRLTPVECERLMGFPDGWTRIPWRGRKEEDCPDSPRYKACGNSMCVNVMRWIGERIGEFSKKEN